MFLVKRVYFLLLFFYLIDKNESEISDTTLTQLENKFSAYEKTIEDLKTELSDLRKEKEFENEITKIKKENEGNWKQFNNEKSYLLIKKSVDFLNAKKICEALNDNNNSNVTLAVIESENERKFISRLLYKEMGFNQSVWITVSKEESDNDRNETNVEFTNWRGGKYWPFNVSNCVQLKYIFSSNDSKLEDTLYGFWENVSCHNNNPILCQKIQSLTLSQVKNAMNDINIKLNELNKNFGEMRSQISHLKSVSGIMRSQGLTQDNEILETSFNELKEEIKYSLNTAVKVQEVYQKRIDELMEQNVDINNKMNEMNKTQEVQEKKNEEMNKKFSINDQKLYELNNKLTSIKIKAYEEKFEQNKKQFSGIDTSLNELKSKLEKQIPIGFIYSQLPGQPEPKTIWPTFQWSDISSQYSGLFFRILGGNSAGFNAIQDENSPRLIRVRMVDGSTTTSKGILGGLIPGYMLDTEANVNANGGWSKNVWLGGIDGKPKSMNFMVSSGEVRPRNQAIRIWKRVQ